MLRSGLVSLILLISTLGVWSSVEGQPLELAGDARTLPLWPGYFPIRPLAPVGGALLFATDDGIHGMELWRTDGTPEGTWMVRDICPGSCGSRPFYTAPENRTGDGSLLFFAAFDGAHGQEPWVSDGTFEGTRMVADLRPGIAESRPEWFRWSGAEMLFTADDGEHGRELWSAGVDGSAATLVADIRPGPEGSHPESLVGGNGSTFFSADDGEHGREPWISDGTTGGTSMLLDLESGEGSSIESVQSFPGHPKQVAWDGSSWWFQRGGASSSPELWVTEGSSAGTRRIEDAQGSPARPYYEIVAAGGVVYFRSGYSLPDGIEIWRTDGTGAGTYRVKDLDPNGEDSISGLTSFGDRVFFRARRSDTGSEPWISDGTEAGTFLLADIAPGADDSVPYGYARPDTVIGERVFFFAGDPTTGAEPWVTDGTPEGTHAIVDARPGPNPSADYLWWPPAFGAVGDAVVFFALAPTPYDHEPWVTTLDGDGASLLADLDDQPSSTVRFLTGALPEMAGLGDVAHWVGIGDDDVVKPWRTRGNPLQAQPLPLTPPLGVDESVWGLLPLRDRGLLVFFRYGDEETWLYRSDGTEPGTHPLAECDDCSEPHLASDRHVVFLSGGAVRITDGDSVWEIAPLEEVWQTAAFGDAILIVGSDASTYGLWRVDPPYETASLIAAHDRPLDPWNLPAPVVAGDRLFYAGADLATGVEPWVSDGLTSSPVSDVAAGPQSSLRLLRSPVFGHYRFSQPVFAPFGDGVLFVADDGVHGQELWRTDGTPENTELVVDLREDELGSEPRWLTKSGDHIYLVADDGIGGRELWRTDGTEIGTEVLDLLPGPESSAPAWLLDVDGVLYFVFTSLDHGVELWTLDQESASPWLVQDLLFGPPSSSPSTPTLAGRRLFVIANDGVAGFEPWSLVVPSRLPRATLASQLGAGGVELVLRVEDSHGLDVPDADGPELELQIPLGLSVLGIDASAGVAVLEGRQLTWTGRVPGDQALVIVLRVAPDDADENESTSWQLQGELHLDTDGDGVNDWTIATDNPALPGDADPTLVGTPSDFLLFGDAFERGNLSSWTRSQGPPP